MKTTAATGLGVLLLVSIVAPAAAQVGPDLVVGDISAVTRFGSVGGVSAYAIGDVACNKGTTVVSWDGVTTRHPVFTSNLYRLMNGRFEHIGMGWARHESFALAQAFCFNDCDGQSGSWLGVHCSTAQSASANGTQSAMGPRSQVNASTGAFTFPVPPSSIPPTIGRRLQVRDTDIDPAMNPGALYFVEGQYVAPDDATAGNGANNAAHRPVTIGPAPGLVISLMGTTVSQEPAIRAWRNVDLEVLVSEVDVLGDGRFLVASRATDLGGGAFHYEYAVQNLTSDRSAGSFSVPLASGVAASAIGFHDVDYHSGEPYSGLDWAAAVGSGAITWSSESESQNPNANALRWGTLYSFRFDCSAPPSAQFATIGLFKAGSPASVAAAIIGPCAGPSPCAAGTVGSGAGTPIPVLTIGGDAGSLCDASVRVAIGVPFTINLDGALSTGSYRYALWMWSGEPANARPFVASGVTLGCTVNPTPLEPGQSPQPVRCLRGGYPPATCGSVRELAHAPARAPWIVSRASGYPRRATFTLQGLEEDPNAANSLGVSVTNSVILRIE